MHASVAPIGTAQPSKPRPRCSEISFDVRVCMEESTERKMDPEPGELESSSAGTSFEALGQQCSRTGRWNEPLSTTVRSSTGVRIWGKQFFPRRTRYQDANR